MLVSAGRARQGHEEVDGGCAAGAGDGSPARPAAGRRGTAGGACCCRQSRPDAKQQWEQHVRLCATQVLVLSIFLTHCALLALHGLMHLETLSPSWRHHLAAADGIGCMSLQWGYARAHIIAAHALAGQEHARHHLRRCAALPCIVPAFIVKATPQCHTFVEAPPSRLLATSALCDVRLWPIL